MSTASTNRQKLHYYFVLLKLGFTIGRGFRGLNQLCEEVPQNHSLWKRDASQSHEVSVGKLLLRIITDLK